MSWNEKTFQNAQFFNEELTPFADQFEWLLSEKVACEAMQEVRCSALAIQVDDLRARHEKRVRPLEEEMRELRRSFLALEQRAAAAGAEADESKQKLQRARREIVRLRQIAAAAQKEVDEVRDAHVDRTRASIDAVRRECEARLDAQRLKHRQELYIREKMLRG